MDCHFLVDACPVFHNTNRKECRDFRLDVNKRAAMRKKALTAMATKSPLQSPTSEQRKHSKAVRVHDAILEHKAYDRPIKW